MAKVQQARGGGPTTTTLHQMATLSPQANSGTVTRSGPISNKLNFFRFDSSANFFLIYLLQARLLQMNLNKICYLGGCITKYFIEI